MARLETLPDGVTLADSLTGAPTDTFYVTWSADGRWLAAEGSDGVVALWSPDDRSSAPARHANRRRHTHVSLTWHPSKPLSGRMCLTGDKSWIRDVAD